MSFTRIDHYEKEYADTHHDTALNVTQGVEEQPIVSPYFKRRKKRALSTGEYVEGILAGNITTLSQAITLVESSNPNHYAQAQEIIEACLPHAGKSVRIGITGVPGAGKSTFIEAIGNMVAGLRHKLAVLAIDPSSERSGGSILGDKTRMESICNNPSVFVRPSPSAGSLGGVPERLARRSCCARPRDSTSSSSKRWASDSRKPPCTRWWTSSCYCRFPVRETNCKASSAASWRWPT